VEALFVLIPISLCLAAGALASFIWAARKGQFSDLLSPAQRVVFEDFADFKDVEDIESLKHQNKEE
jgi:cbb3-type cytochrome oxidase maturation protein